MNAPVVVKAVDVGPDVAFGMRVIGVPFLVDPFAFQTSKESFYRRVDAPMSSEARRIRQVGQNKWVQFPDDVSFQAAVDFLI